MGQAARFGGRPRLTLPGAERQLRDPQAGQLVGGSGSAPTEMRPASHEWAHRAQRHMRTGIIARRASPGASGPLV